MNIDNDTFAFTNNVRDYDGVEARQYMFLAPPFSVWHLDKSMMTMPLLLIFALWWIGSLTSAYIRNYGMSFQWLNLISAPLRGVAHALTSQFPIAVLTTLGLTAGATVVAILVAKGHIAKATVQILIISVVAIMEPIVLHNQLDDILSPSGLLAKGRDVGVSVAAGLNGVDSPDPAREADAMGTSEVTYQMRFELEDLNFGKNIDRNRQCRADYSVGTKSQDENQTLQWLKICDPAAYHAAENPSAAQIATGLLMILTMIIDLIFSMVFMISIVGAAMNAVYWGFAALGSVVLGGYVAGPTQTIAIRSLFHGVFSAATMAGTVIFVSAYELFMGDLYLQAQGNTIQISLVAGIVELVTLFQYRNFRRGWRSADSRTVNRVVLAAKNGVHFGYGPGVGSAASVGGGTALGMGTIAASGHGIGVIRAATAAAALNSAPWMSWLAGGVQNSLQPLSRVQRRTTRTQGNIWQQLGGVNGPYVLSMLKVEPYLRVAQDAVHEHGADTIRGVVATIQGIRNLDQSASLGDSYGPLVGAGNNDYHLMDTVWNAWSTVKRGEEDETLKYGPIGRVASAMKQAEINTYRLINGHGDELLTAAHVEILRHAINEYQGLNSDRPVLEPLEQALADRYLYNLPGPDGTYMNKRQFVMDIKAMFEGEDPSGPLAGELMQIGGNREERRIRARRIYGALGVGHARIISDRMDEVGRNLGDHQIWRQLRNDISDAMDTDARTSGTELIPNHALHPYDSRRPENPGWRGAMAAVEQHLQ
ncbi:hypothetical protein [Nocardia sp. CDC160]|uniref:hypothetical protein n=1 Tax=Nocardia sp. CDC160 TaxID=3112166 RepID=UPI002DBA5D8B|nr:hypothetical protein [Nocardia sp. CDC160]MEC3920665.1 hypothetical protein [Nocardia sp. CDC160]